MDILEVLAQDHVRMAEEMQDIYDSFRGGEVLLKVRMFVAHYEVHESIEEELLLPPLGNFADGDGGDLVFEYERDHTRIWELLDELRKAMQTQHVPLVHRAFDHFRSFVLAHMKSEEKILFPIARTRLVPKFLEKLGQEAARKLQHHFASAQPAHKEAI